jgi:hypothetical protein
VYGSEDAISVVGRSSVPPTLVTALLSNTGRFHWLSKKRDLRQKKNLFAFYFSFIFNSSKIVDNGFSFFPWEKERKGKAKKRKGKNSIVQHQLLFSHFFCLFFFLFPFLFLYFKRPFCFIIFTYFFSIYENFG